MMCWFRLALVFVIVSLSEVQAQFASLPASFAVRTVSGYAVPYQNGMPVPTFEKQRRTTLDLAGIWRKQRFVANDGFSLGLRSGSNYDSLIAEAAGRQLPSYDDGSWQAKMLPAVENTMHGVNVRPEDYEEGVWYRRTFVLPDSLNGRFARLNFYAVNYVADVWLNGVYLGYHEGGYTSFSFDATGALRFDSANVLVVRVDNPAWGSRNDVVPYGTLTHKPDWFNYTGIIHDVYLEFANKFSIARAEAIPLSTDGTVQVTATVLNRTGSPQSADVTFEVYEAVVDSTNIQSEYPADLTGSFVTSQAATINVPADSAGAVRCTITIPTPRLWSPRHPHLYILRTVLSSGSTVIDQLHNQFGVRTVATLEKTLLLNGKPMFLPGIARHEDHATYGRSVPLSMIYSDLLKVLDLNAMFLRTAHYPNHPYTYLLADRLGIAVLEEIPVWWFDESIAWLKQDAVRHIHEQMWREMLFRDRNRPSILFWSTCNECLVVTERGNFIARLNTELDAQYPDGRLVTESAAADRPGPTDPTQAYADVAGWTMYFGIFHGGTYYGGTKNFLTQAQVTYPKKPIIDTEFGYWTTEDMSVAPVQVTVFDSTFAAFNEFVSVDSNGVYHPDRPLATTTWWTIFDWCTIQQGTGAQTMGVYQMDHTTIKPVAGHIRDTYARFKATSETAVLSVDRPGQESPAEFRLHQNYPNPFNPTTIISWQMPVAGHVRLTIYDLLGRAVATLVNEVRNPGTSTAQWNAAGLASGVYLCQLQAGSFVASKKLMLIK
jgi:beta-galactosidase